MARASRSEGDATRAPSEVVASEVAVTAGRSREELDALLDEIDEILEDDAEEFVRGYVQKGGQ
ncbi:MAG: Pup-like protein [Actinomycetota bacterium]